VLNSDRCLRNLKLLHLAHHLESPNLYWRAKPDPNCAVIVRFFGRCKGLAIAQKIAPWQRHWRSATRLQVFVHPKGLAIAPPQYPHRKNIVALRPNLCCCSAIAYLIKAQGISKRSHRNKGTKNDRAIHRSSCLRPRSAIAPSSETFVASRLGDRAKCHLFNGEVSPNPSIYIVWTFVDWAAKGTNPSLARGARGLFVYFDRHPLRSLALCGLCTFCG